MIDPEVSICIPVYNRENCIRDAIESANAQTFENVEIVVCDNNSTDDTLNICAELAEEDSRICLYKFDTNIGAVGNFNRCIEKARGTYIKFLMSDDLLAPNCVERMVEAIASDREIRLVSAVQKDTTFDGKFVRINRMFEQSGVYDGRAIAKDLLMQMCNKIGAPTSFLARREDCLEGFKPELFYFNDFEFSLRLLVQGKFYFINEELSVLRLNPSTLTTAYSKTLIQLADNLKLRDQFCDFMISQGISADQWHKKVDETILGTVDYLLLEDGTTIEEVNENAKKIATLIGPEHHDEAFRTFANLVYYAFSKLHKLNIENRWNEGQVKNLEKTLSDIKATRSWRIREFMEKAFLGRE